MTKEDKLLLVKDLSARLPYGVEIEHIKSGMRGVLHELNVYPLYDDNDNIFDCICNTDFFGDGDSFDISEFKPYLFPLSNLTQEQMVEYYNTLYLDDKCNKYLTDKSLDWLYKNHMDIYGLIPKDLALDATGKNIYN